MKEHADDDSETVLIEELGVCRGQVRVDIAVVNGLLHGIEIKSDRDSLARLAGQCHFYSKVFDKVMLVVGSRHLEEAEKIVPAWWSLMLVEQCGPDVQFTRIRDGGKNPDLEPRCLVELLWLDESLALLEQRGVTHGVKGKPRSIIWDRICAHFSVQEIAARVRCHLKTRARKLVHDRLDVVDGSEPSPF